MLPKCPTRPMLSRYAVPLLCAAAIVFACAPRPHAAADAAAASAPALSTKGTLTAEPTPKPKKPSAEDLARQPLASSLDVAVSAAQATKDVRFALHVTNRADKNVELMCPSGQTHEFLVTDESGREVWRWSEGRMFTQALQSKLLGGAETATYEETWQPGTRTGHFTVVATLRSSSHTVEQVAQFDVR